MKLTESRIKEIILEEIQAIAEEDQQSSNNQEQGKKDETKSLTALRQFYINMSKEIPQMKGVSPAEVQQIAELNKLMFKMLGKGEIAKYLQYAREQFGRKLGVDK